MAAIVTDYASFNAQLNRQFGPGCDVEVAAYIGRKLTLCVAWGEEVFCRSGAHSPAEIGMQTTAAYRSCELRENYCVDTEQKNCSEQ